MSPSPTWQLLQLTSLANAVASAVFKGMLVLRLQAAWGDRGGDMAENGGDIGGDLGEI